MLQRDGGADEELGLDGRRADRGGEEPPVIGLHERGQGKDGQLEGHLLHRAEGDEQGQQRGQVGNNPDLQGTDGEGGEGDLPRHPGRPSRAPHPHSSAHPESI